jgi:FeS assembly SUF system regulator
MLRISKLADYAILIMHCLAVANDCSMLSATDVANTTNLALPTVKKVLKMLCEAGLLTSVRGADGGYALSKQAKDIKLVQIITAIEGSPAVTECAAERHNCKQSDTCAVKHNWQIINQYILLMLANISLAEMATPLKMENLFMFCVKN